MQEVVIYTRFSPRPDHEECDSCEKQAQRCWDYLEREAVSRGCKYTVLEVCEDKNVSGGVYERPGLKRALERLVCRDRRRMLLVDSADRLARDVMVAGMIKADVEKAGAYIEYANGISPTDTPEGKFLDNILSAVAALERDKIRARTKAGLARKAAAGVYLGKVPIGYMRDPETKGLVECPEEREIVNEIKFKRLHFGLTSKAIARQIQINHGQIRGNTWSDRTVRKLLKPGRDQKILARIQAAKENQE